MTESATGFMDGVLHDPEQPNQRSGPAWGAVISLALGTFGLVTAEFLPASVLTPLAHDLGITEGAAGQALTATAIVGAIAAPTMAIITNRLDRRIVMWAMTLLLILSNVLSAVAGSLPVLLTARVVLGIAIGGFWSISAALAMRLVPSHLLQRAMSIILTGVTVATVCAAPIGAYVGDIWGWRTAFMIAAVVAAITLVVQLVALPRLPPIGPASFRRLLDVARNPTIKVAILVVLLAASGHFAGFAYIRAFLEDVPALNIATISLVLLVFGIGGFFGNLAGGVLAEHSLKAVAALPPLIIALAAVSLLTLGASAWAAVIAVSVWGFAFGAVPVGLQTWMVLRAAPEHAENAGGLMAATFQVAIGAGAVFGGLLVDNAGVASVFAYSAVASFLAALTVFLLGPKRDA
ncbi:MAG: MFS transporter [Mesorhizobium sp.]|uniref:MFS transporter n=1 Tax=unclassified Mesorhizobium TaxID=325217 RepID=UPI000FDC9000|nr:MULTISPECIES: MFS transporter [unclassified Mesorhizobium]RWC99652.1 MAG: MFS transporter [Mesorhizobium sp.]RWE20090.1 MAG: MFS transporter [Mesorhizobium sp.]TGQ19241.1 MFS transporter [Mesorhizobium sp. M00.F.Ca.ET.217.01.1.1]TGV90154.1 MFS transporter [Mesorhizobium sp. M00.F.Ca.ET.158.01.1.1]